MKTIKLDASQTGDVKVRKIESPFDAYRFIYPDLANLKHREAFFVTMDDSNNVISKVLAYVGDDEPDLDLRDLVKTVFKDNASKVMIFTNRIDGCFLPAESTLGDREAEHDTLSALGITLVDHILVCNCDICYSFAGESPFKVEWINVPQTEE